MMTVPGVGLLSGAIAQEKRILKHLLSIGSGRNGMEPFFPVGAS